MNQARVAASHLDVGGSADESRERAVTQLVRCARLSPDAARTLEWAVDTLDTHGSDGSDRVACQLLRAARARVEPRGDAQRHRVLQRSTAR